jgi:DNA replication protein DnaC
VVIDAAQSAEAMALRVRRGRRRGRPAAGVATIRQLVQREAEDRQQRHVERLLRESRLPLEKDLACFDLKRLPPKAAQQIKVLAEGSFVDRRENVLAFGKPGSGKSHALCAIGQELMRASQGRYKVYFASCALMIQELLLAKRDLKLSRFVKRLGGYHALLLDDLGYEQQSQEERVRCPHAAFANRRVSSRFFARQRGSKA